MWLYDATPRRVSPLNGETSGPRPAGAVVAGHARGNVSSAEVRALEVSIAAELQAPAMARAAVERWLAGRVSATLFDAVRLLVSELVTNSVTHAQLAGDATIRVSVAMSDGVVRLEVENPGEGAVAARRPDRETGGGFGLYLVDVIAERWGCRHDGTTCVWAELAVSPAM
jgi:anti-sigma regulatory factor (Ser/Thr protein kinase)